MQGQIIDVDEELAGARLTPFYWKLGAMLGTLTLFDGYDTFNPAYVIHYVMKPWGLTPAQAGFLVSSGLIGFMIGAGAHELIADRIGRRATLLGGLWIMTIFTLATAAFGTSYGSFCTLRLITGLGLGVLLPLSITYINELTPRHVANTYTVWGVALGWALGGTMASVVGVLATPVYGWRSLYFIGAVSLLLIPVLHVTLPESVKFLALKGRTDEIRTLLARLRPERAARYACAPIAAERPGQSGNGLAILLSRRYVRTTLATWVAAFFCLFCIFGLSGWIPTVMIGRGKSFAASFGFGALIQIASFVGALACGWLADRFGARRPVLVIWMALGAASVLGLALLNTHLSNWVLVFAAGFFIMGGMFILNNFTSGAYETGVRATAVGMVLGVGRIGAVLGPWISGWMQELYPGPTAMFLAIAAASLISALAIGMARAHAGEPTMTPVGVA